MPTGIYDRSHLKGKMELLPKSIFKKECIPHNKGIQTEYVKKKVNRFKLGLDIFCKKHGEHKRWRLHSDNNVQCLHCCSEQQMKQRRKNPVNFIFRDAKKHAESRSREFSITIEDLNDCIQKQDNLCSLSGIKFDNENIMSLDRIDSKKGYTKDNIQFILKDINVMKSNLTEERFIFLCGKITKRKL